MNTSTVKLPQDTYDRLLVSLNRNAKALHDPGLTAWRKKLETSARTEADGVIVGAPYLSIISEELTRIVQKNGHKYGSGGDKLLIIEIEEAFEAANYVPPALSSSPARPAPPAPVAPKSPRFPPTSRFFEERRWDNDDDDPIQTIDLSQLPEPY